jgi:hypothetical protein
MIIHGLKTGDRCITYGSRDDVCFFCAEEQALKNRKDSNNSRNISRDSAAREIRGKHSGKPLFRFPISGGPYFICQDHMHKFMKKMDDLLPWEDPNQGLPIEDDEE